VQIICAEIEWSFPNAVTPKGEKNNWTPKRENLLKLEEQIVNKKLKKIHHKHNYQVYHHRLQT